MRTDIIYASIDIGSNTILLLTKVWQDGNWQEENYIRFAKLAENISSENIISKGAIERSTEFLKEYRAVIEEHQSHFLTHQVKIKAVATNALRDANNQSEVVKLLSAALGHPITVISPEKEAYYTYTGTIDDLLPTTDSFVKFPVVIDIGGGSTEFMLGSENSEIESKSYRIGAVRFKEEFIDEFPVTSPTIEKVYAEIDQIIDVDYPDFIPSPNSISTPISTTIPLVGVAGIPTTLAAIKYNGREIDYSKIHLKTLTLDDLDEFEKLFCGMTPEEIIASGLVDERRAEIMAISCIILKKLMLKFHYQTLTVSIKGLRYGVLREMISEMD